MKKLMRRTVAFMLMACLLLSVITPAAMAVDYNSETNAYTYDIDGLEESNGSAYDSKGYKGLGSLKGTTFGDFTYLTSGTKVGNPRIYRTGEEGAYEYAYGGSFDLSTNSAETLWVAFKFNVAEKGDYKLTFNTGNFVANVIVELYDSAKTYDDTYVKNLVSQGTTSDTIEMSLDQADYVIFLQAAGTYKQARFYDMTLTKEAVIEPASATFDFRSGSQTSNWTKINGRDPGSYGVYINSATTLVVQLAPEMGAGMYKLDLDVRQYESGDVREVYLIPTSVFGGETITADLADEKLSADYYVGTVDGYEDGYDLSVNYELKKQGAYVLALKNIGIRENNRVTVSTLTMEPLYKVVNGTYYTVAEAIEAGETNIQLTGNLTENITLQNGETLDLNGNTITGNVAAAVGSVIDTKATGGIVGTVNVPTDNPYIALNDNGTYRFFDYELVTIADNGKKAADSDAVYFGFGLYFTNAAAYDYVTSENLTISATLTWTGEKAGSAEIQGMDTAFADWKTAAPTAAGKCFLITVTGVAANLEAGSVVTIAPSFETDGGNKGNFGGSINYTVPQA